MNRKKKIIILISAVCLMLSVNIVLLPKTHPENTNKNKGNIIVEITNFKNNDGYVLAGLYNSAKGFPGSTESMIMRERGSITDKKAVIEFKDVPYGTYAVSGYHDENNNEKLDTGMFKIPKEGLITSNNAKGRFGPAKFEDAKFELKSSELMLKIKVLYY
jgi:uncharacterized protein (DUF2141 family)